MLTKIKGFNCLLVPEVPKRMTKSGNETLFSRKMEWTAKFPAAERWLELSLNSAQMNTYLIALILHKWFIRSANPLIRGLETNHISNTLFKLIEGNCISWRNDNIGKC